MATPSPGNSSQGGGGASIDEGGGGWEVFKQLLLPLVATVCACIWLLFITYYHSRWWGFVLTKIANRFIKEGYLHVGSISFSVLSGKLMFRDVAYITADYACRVQDGLLILRWWRQYQPIGQKDDALQCVSRVYVLLNGLEFHCYNISSVYNEIEKSFQPKTDTGTESQESTGSGDKRSKSSSLNTRPALLDWRDFVGVVKFDIHNGRTVFGNPFVPSVLILSIEDAKGSYTTRSPSAPWDFFMHEVLCEGEQFKVILAPSPKFEGPTDEPPRYMGEGFVVVQSNTLHFHYSQDEAGFVPLNDCGADELIPPCWALDVTCGAATNISYGPWADRQRDALHKFFFPQAYKTHEVTPKARPGQKRQFTSFEFRLNTVAEATIDILFSKDKETNAFHIDVDKASYVEVSIPLLIGPEGYHTRVTGQLLHVDSSTSMEYRSLIESETLQFQVAMHYPRLWNHHQNWEVTLTFSKATTYLLYAHKGFVSDLFSDWSTKSRSDLFGFVPYTVNINIILREFVLMLPTNKYNWVDCSSRQQQNVFIGLVGDLLDLSIVLPYSDYLPPSLPVTVVLRADSVSGRLCFPECYSSQHCLQGLDRSTKGPDSWGEDKKQLGLSSDHWQGTTQEDGWVECAAVPYVAVSITYTYHPMPLDEDSPMIQIRRTPSGRPEHQSHPAQTSYAGWKRPGRIAVPSEWLPDRLQLEVDIGPAILMAYGSIVKCILALKENYFGVDQVPTDFIRPPSDGLEDNPKDTEGRIVNGLALRHMDVIVSLNVDGIKATLPVYCGKTEPSCPIAVLDQLCFELQKGHSETRLQLLLSPVTIMVSDSQKRVDSHLCDGHLGLSGLQLRGHAMFSDEGLPMDSETVEYAWLLDLQMGVLSGRLTPPQTLSLVSFLQLFVHLAVDPLDDLQQPITSKNCVHMVKQQRCRIKEPLYPIPCPTEDDYKYRMLRVSLRRVELMLVETGCALQVQVGLLNMGKCNLHSASIGNGLSTTIRQIEVKQFVSQSDKPQATWLQACSLDCPELQLDLASVLRSKDSFKAQNHFLTVRDKKTRRLWFLWKANPDEPLNWPRAKCGCRGGCLFFNAPDPNTVPDWMGDTSSWKAPLTEVDRDYGRSILQQGQWIFSVCDRTPVDSPSREFKFTQGFVTVTASTLPREMETGEVRADSPDAAGSSSSLREPVKVPSKRDSSSVSVPDSQQQPSRNVSLSTSSAQVSTTSDPTLTIKTGSDSSVFERHPYHFHGSSHSLPVEAMALQSKLTLGRGNLSAEMIRHLQADANMTSAPLSPPMLRSKEVSDLPRMRDSCGSVSSHAESEYYSAEDDFTLNGTMSKTLVDTPSSGSFDTNAQESSPSKSFADETLSSASTQQVESPGSLQRQDEIDVKRHSSSASYVSAASSESSLHTQKKLKDASPQSPTQPHPWVSPKAYCHHLTLWDCHGWVTHPPGHTLQTHPPFSPLCAPATTLIKGNIPLPEFSVTQAGLRPGLVRMTDVEQNDICTESESEDEDSADSEMFLGLPPQEVRRHNRVHSSPPSYQSTKTLATQCQSSSNAAILSVKGALDILLTPLLMQALDRYLQSAGNVLCLRHPEAIVDVLHMDCIGDVQAAFKNANKAAGHNSTEFTISLALAVPKVNLLVVQASTEYDKHQHHVNQASLLVGCISNIQVQLMNKTTAEETDSNTPSPAEKKQKLEEILSGSRYGLHTADQDPALKNLESSAVGQVSVGKVHCQLRGLDCPGKDRKKRHMSGVTSIPHSLSKVMFTLVPLSGSEEAEDVTVTAPTGCSLMECGIEGIAVSGSMQCAPVSPQPSTAAPSRTHSRQPSQNWQVSPEYLSTTQSDHQGVPWGRARSICDVLPNASSGMELRHSDVTLAKQAGKPTKSRIVDGKMVISSVWFHAPTPSRLSNDHSAGVQSGLNPVSALSLIVTTWLPASQQALIRLNSLKAANHLRVCAVMACIMAEAHEMSSTHYITAKSKYKRWTSETDAIGQDLSCQLFTTLWYYLHTSNPQRIEKLVSEDVPAIHVLEQGTHALIRQWKVILSMLNPAVTAAQFPASRLPQLDEQDGVDPLAAAGALDPNLPAHTLQTQYSGASVDLDIGPQDPSQLITQPGIEKDDPESVLLKPYSSKYGTGYSMYEEFAGTSKVLENAEKFHEVPGNVTGDGGTEQTSRHRSHTASSCTQSISGTPGRHQMLEAGGQKLSIDSAEEGAEMVEDERGVEEAGTTDEAYKNAQPQDLNLNLPYSNSFIPDAAITPTIMQLGDADILFKPLLKHLGIARKQPEHFIIKKNLQQTSVTLELQRLSLTIVESSPRQRSSSRGKKSRDKDPARNKASFPSFSSESLVLKFSLNECTETGRQTPELGDRSLKPSPSDSSGMPVNQGGQCQALAAYISIHWARAMPVMNMPLLRLLSQLVQVGQAMQEAKRHLPGSKSGTDTEPSTMNSDLSATMLRQQATLPRVDSPDGHHGDTISFSSQADSEVIAQCWQTMYHLMNLYSGVTQPINSLDTSHVIVNPLFRIENEHMIGRSRDRGSTSEYRRLVEELDEVDGGLPSKTTKEEPTQQPLHVTMLCTILLEELCVVSQLAGLQCEAELNDVTACVNTKLVVPAPGSGQKHCSQRSVLITCDEVIVVLSERQKPNPLCVVTLTLDKPQASCVVASHSDPSHVITHFSWQSLDASLPINLATLHGVVTRSKRKLTHRIRELQSALAQPQAAAGEGETDGEGAGTGPGEEESERGQTDPPASAEAIAADVASPGSTNWHIASTLMLNNVSLQAVVLPSLKAQYIIREIKGTASCEGGMTKYGIEMPTHCLKFSSKGKDGDQLSTADIDLPCITFSGQYILPKQPEPSKTTAAVAAAALPCPASLDSVITIEALHHSISTGLVNHLITVQQVFLTDLSSLLDDVFGIDDPRKPTQHEDVTETAVASRSDFDISLLVKLKGVQITAITPSASAMRLETGAVEVQLSNRMTGAGGTTISEPGSMKLYAKALIDLNISLGTMQRSHGQSEADPELHQLAYFKANIGLTNAPRQDNMASLKDEKAAFLVTLTKPILYLQPSAVDIAVLVWVCYHSAYEQWRDQQKQTAGTRVQATRNPLHRQPTSLEKLSSVFLQLTLQDLGICIPINPTFQNISSLSGGMPEPDYHSALVLTLESSLITACYNRSLVTKGFFQTFCLRFAEDFNTSLENWKPLIYKGLMNSCVVPQGTLELCSRTVSADRTDPAQTSNAGKWMLNFLWRMEGFDVQVNPSIGRQLSALANTLTALAGDDDEVDVADLSSVAEPQDEPDGMMPATSESKPVLRRPTSLFVSKQDAKRHSKMVMQEMTEQAKIVSDLRTLGAKKVTIAEEQEKLRQLEMAVFNDFRRDIRKRLRMQTMKASLRSKLTAGLPRSPAGVPRQASVGGRTASQGMSAAPVTGAKPFSKPGYKTPIGKRPQAISEYTPHPSHVTFNLPRSTPSPLDELPPFVTGTSSVGIPQTEPRRRIRSIGSPEYAELNATISDPTDIERDLTAPAGSRARRRLLQLHSGSVPEEMDSGSEGSDHEEDGGVAPQVSQSWPRPRSSSSQRRGRTGLHIDPKLQLQQQHQQAPVSPAHSTKVEPPTVDFELDVKFNIDSGMLVLNCHGMEEQGDVSIMGRTGDARRPPGLYDDIITTHARPLLSRHPSPGLMEPPKQSVFYLPAFDVKLHYQSSVNSGTAGRTNDSDREREPQQGTTSSAADTSSTEGSIDKKSQHGSKQAVLYTWFMLTSPPKEVVVSLSLLDFLEEALETVPTSAATAQTSDLTQSVEDIGVSANSLVSSSTMDSSTFPVDVVVYVCLKPSVICLSCLPASKVECLLKLPTVEFAFSSRGSSQTDHLADSSTVLDTSHSSTTSKGSRVTLTGDVSDRVGLSIAAVMSDFSLYVFHPYGGSQRRERLVEEMESRTDVGSEEGNVPWTTPSRKDALSLKVEFIKINMSRSRKLVTMPSASAASIDQGVETLAGARQDQLHQERRDTDLLAASQQQPRPLSHQQSPPFFRDERPKSPALSSSPSTSQNNNQFSILCDIGTAAFKYDMRRLTEIMAFPKAWYRKSIMKRMFLGEEQTAQESDDQPSSASVSSSATSSDYEDDYSPQKVPHVLKKHTPSLKRDFPFPPPSPSVFSVHSQHSSPATSDAKSVPSVAAVQHRLAKEAPQDRDHSLASLPSDSLRRSGSGSGTSSSAGGTVKAGPTWHTSVRVGVNFTKLDIHMNMSNVMGSTVWSTTDLRTQGYVSIDSVGSKEIQMCTSLRQSTLEAKGGVIGGQVVIEQLGGTSSHSQQPSHAPSHKLGAGLGLMTVRIDYMGSSIIMQRLDKVQVQLSDEWKLADMTGANTSHSRSSSVYLDGQLEWDTFQLMLSRSSTPDLIKMTGRLEEFFSQQFQSSKRMLASWQLGGSSGVSSQPSSEGTRTGSESSSTRSLERLTMQAERNYHRHWQPAFALLRSCRSNSKLLPPQWHAGNLTLGGHVLLSGQRTLLACFHGINFRASSWALFTLQEPQLHFETEAVPIRPSKSDGQDGTNIIEDLVFNLGHNQTERGEGSMGVIYRVTRTERHHFPTNGTIDQCFHYVCAIKAPEDFEHVLTSSSMPVYSSKETFRHTAEPIFALPKLQLEMKSNHMQSTHSPALNGPPQAVTVSFVTHFTDHINVAMDIELILFLHAFVTAYISYKDKATQSHRNSVSSRPTMKASTEQDILSLPEPASTATSEVTPSSGASDWREFQCITWQLEPTIRLLSWGGKQIEPIGVDYILQKLGFSHARVTIPKWMQRGAMDPLDKTLALLMEKLIQYIKEND
ncbi:uncharacterized protein KIAA1109-like isoform X2 [Acanthaster planci]|uniref:Uncharacterized protein KIAA1109-like isoform X2 n=1 Tax=Acanthaster planci TaxID=133434 RepID=A0A8B7YXU6_ACAPL|nr:uncharacterized protein KIAA1109-like isoform X2 [Acanthaster planci]